VHIDFSSADGIIFSITLISTVVMKLFLLLVAIYSLIFYQQYKIEKANAAVPGTRGPINMKGAYQQIDLPDKAGFVNAEILMKNYYSVYRYFNLKERPAMTTFSIRK
jgi:hypothetical protein